MALSDKEFDDLKTKIIAASYGHGRWLVGQAERANASVVQVERLRRLIAPNTFVPSHVSSYPLDRARESVQADLERVSGLIQEAGRVLGQRDTDDADYYDECFWRSRYTPRVLTLEGRTPPANVVELPIECKTFQVLEKTRHFKQLNAALKRAGVDLSFYSTSSAPPVRTFQFESPGRVAPA